MKKVLKKKIKNFINLILLIFIIILSMELFSRLFFYQGHLPRNLYTSDSELVFINNPNNIIKYNNHFVTINSYGLRGNQISEKTNQTRILFVDASLLFNGAVKDNETFVYQLEQKLNQNLNDTKYEILNGGVAGYTPLQKSLLIQKLIDINTISPDKVVFCFSGHDFINPDELSRMIVRNGWAIQKQYEIVNPTVLNIELFFFQNSNLARMMKTIIDKIGNSKTKTNNSTEIQTELSELQLEDVDKLVNIILDTKQKVENKNIEFEVFFNINKFNIIQQNIIYEKEVLLLKQKLDENNVKYYDPTTEFVNNTSSPINLFLPENNIHYNSKGSEILAEIYSDYMLNQTS